MTYKKKGFSRQINIVVPRNIAKDIEQNSLINDLYVTDIGYYPSAKYHIEKEK